MAVARPADLGTDVGSDLMDRDGTPSAGGRAGEDLEAAAGLPAGGRRAGWAGVRPLVVRLHFYAGIVVAPFLVVAAVTGLLYAASFQLETVVYDQVLRVPVPVGQRALPLSAQVAAARAEHPEGTLSAVRPAPRADTTTRVLLEVPGLAEGHRRAVFVDPFTGEVRGALETYGTAGALPLRTWIDELHRDLHLGEPGRVYSELAASWLWMVAGGGLLLWVGRRRPTRRLRGLLLPDRGAAGRRRTMSWHGAVGVWVAVGLLFVSATGLTWSRYSGHHVSELRERLGWATPALSTTTATTTAGTTAGTTANNTHHGGPPTHNHHTDAAVHAHAETADVGVDVGVDRVLRAARDKGLSDPVQITWPSGPGSAYTVAQIQRRWPTRQDAVAVDPATGRVTDEVRFADYPVMAKLSRWGTDLHMGLLFGLANQIAQALLASALICLIVWGYRMWWQRRPHQDRAFGVGRPVARGAWRQVPLRVLVPLAAATAVLGVLMPLFGLSLGAFLAVDIVLGVVARRRVRRHGRHMLASGS